HRSVGQKVREYASLEEINSHGCKVRAFGGLFWTQAERCRIGAHFVQSVTLGFLAKLPDPAIHIKFEQTKAGRHRFALRYHANTDVGAALPMAVEEPLVVHAIELIARENELVIVVAAGEPVQVLPDGVRRALEPVGVGSGLFGSQHLDETLRKRIEAVGIRDVVVQRSRVELSQDKDSLQCGVETITDRYVNQTTLTTQRHGGLRAILG